MHQALSSEKGILEAEIVRENHHGEMFAREKHHHKRKLWKKSISKVCTRKASSYGKAMGEKHHKRKKL